MKAIFKKFSWVGPLLWLILAGLFCWQHSPLFLSILASISGALSASLLAQHPLFEKVQLKRVWLLGLILVGATHFVSNSLRWVTLPSRLLGGGAVYQLSDSFFWLLASFSLVFVLRLSSQRRPELISLELLVAGAVLVDLFSAHRQGFINRPYALVDPLWARGIDPLPVFLGIGAVVTILLLFLGASHSPKKGRWLDVALLSLLLGLLYLFAPLDKLKDINEAPLAEATPSSSGTKAPASPSDQGEPARPTPSESVSSPSPNIDGPGSSPSPGEKGPGSSPSPGEKGPGSSPSPGEKGPGSSPSPSEKGPGSSPSPSEKGPGSSPSPGEKENPSLAQGSQESPDQPDQKLDQNSGQGGNSKELTFSDSSSGSGENPPVAVVIFRDDYVPETGMYYFRQGAFSQYNGTKLVEDSSGLYDLDVAREFPGEKPLEPQMPPLEKSLYKPVETKVALLVEHVKPFALTSPTQWRATSNPDPKRFQKAFEVDSLVLDRPIKEILGHAAGSPTWDKQTWEHYTNAPADPRYQKLLTEILANYPKANKNDPLLRALMVKLWLEEKGTYSLASKHEGAADPTADFLFGDRTGYCVFFAHAAVYLYRTAGMPARTASGYAVPSSQRGQGSSLLIPSKSAHSWPEVYLDGLGWVVLDISPARSLDEPPPPSDPGLQQMLGEMARQEPEEPPIDEEEQKLDIQGTLRKAAASLGQALPYLVLVVLALLYLAKAYRRYAPWLWNKKALSQTSLRSVLDLLADVGLNRQRGEPREVFSRRCQKLSPTFHLMTQAHLHQKLGNPEAVALDYPWTEYLAKARQEIKACVPLWQRLRGIINPINWMKVH